MSPRCRGVAALLVVAAAFGAPTASGQRASGREWRVGAATRRFVPQGIYNWRGAATHALVTSIWYPVTPATSMADHYIGPPGSPLFRPGEWADDAPAAGRFPLIALSHGTGGSAQIMAWLARGLASRGYIVAAVNHPGNNALEGYTAEGFLIWWERARDLTTAIDMLLRDRELGRIIDPIQVGAIGFSLGGYTVVEMPEAERIQLVAGTDDRIVPVRSNAHRLATLTPRSSLTLLPGVGHYTFLATCTEAGRMALPLLCDDANDVDRNAIHQRTVDNAAQFFDRTLK